MGVFQTVQSDTAILSMERYGAGQTDCRLSAVGFCSSSHRDAVYSLYSMCERTNCVQRQREIRLFLVQTLLNIHHLLSVLLICGKGLCICVWVKSCLNCRDQMSPQG